MIWGRLSIISQRLLAKREQGLSEVFIIVLDGNDIMQIGVFQAHDTTWVDDGMNGSVCICLWNFFYKRAGSLPIQQGLHEEEGMHNQEPIYKEEAEEAALNERKEQAHCMI